MKRLSLQEGIVQLERPLTRMDRFKILEAMRVVMKDLSDSYMIDPSEFSRGKKRVWVTVGEYERMAVARLNGMIAAGKAE